MRDDRRRSAPEPVATILDSVLDQYGLSERMSERQLLLAWPEIVGEKIARHSRAVDIQDGVLTLQADHAVWRQELTLLMPRIVEKYNALFGKGTVRQIRWDRRLPGRKGYGNPC